MNWNFFILCIWFALSGIEYAIILPTINEYLNQIDENNEQIYLGISLSAFSITGLLFSPIYGRITDKTSSLKFTIIASNLFEVAGNIFYMASNKAWMVVVSRLIAGIGSGSGSSIFGTISRTTSKKQRTSKIAQLMSVRQIGLLIGPAFNLLFKDLNIYMGSIHVNNLSGAGFFMAIIWSLYSLIILFFYKEDYDEVVEEVDNEAEGLLNKSINEDYGSTSQQDKQQLAENKTENNQFNPHSWSNIYKDLFREEVIVCLSATFFIMFIQTGFETILTPLTLQYFEWDTVGNSLFFLGGGIDCIVSCFIMMKVSHKVSDRRMMLVSFIICCILVALYIPLNIYASRVPAGTPWVYAAFLTHSVVFIFIIPFLFNPQVSLFSKITNVETQAFNQGVRLSVRGIGQIIGPLWASSLLQENFSLMMSTNLAACGIVLVMIILSYNRLGDQGYKKENILVDA